ncbi:MAG: transporter substrate-binding domain-containing protein [Chloroflexi bacterium]|nr:transporter substrate-binding domain-containing protein [Chloroflexota bacterium]
MGIYQNPPLEYIDDAGNAQGFVVDLLQAIAQEEGWQLEYVPCKWADCLQQLEEGQIDLMGAIAYSDERAQRFDFNAETYFVNWGAIYARPGHPIQSLLDLDGTTLVVLQKDIYVNAIRDLLSQFDIHPTYIEVRDYHAVFEAVESGEADAGVVNHLFGDLHAYEYQVEQTPIVFHPIEVRFAAPKGTHQDLLTALDIHLASWKHTPDSPYYQFLDHWFSGSQPSPALPAWALWVLGILAFAAILFIGVSSLLRAQVRVRTAELQESKNRYHSLFENSPISLWEEDLSEVKKYIDALRAQGTSDFRAYFKSHPESVKHCASLVKILDVNQATLDMYHASDKTELLAGLPKIFTPQSFQVFREGLVALTEGKLNQTHEATTKTLTGKEIFHSIHWSVPAGYEETWERVAVSLVDLSKRKQAEERVRNIVENAVEGIFQSTLQGQFISINPTMARIYGYESPEEMIAAVTNIRDQLYVNPQDRDRFIRQLQKHDIVKGFEEKNYRKDGSIIWTTTNARLVRDADGNVLYIEGFVEDITTRKQTEIEIHARTEELTALNTLSRNVNRSLSLDEVVSSAVDGMLDAAHPDLAFFFLRDGDRLLLKGIAPQHAEQRFGEVPEHRVGECMCGLAVSTKKKLYSLDIFTDTRCSWEECKRAGLRSFAALPLVSGEEVIGVIGLASETERDFRQQSEFLETLTSQVAISLQNALLHDRIQNYAAELEKRVAERTAELVTKNSELETFAYTVSHDLKAPLRSIDGYSHLLLEDHSDKLDGEGRLFLYNVRNAANHMAQLIDDLLAYSRFERRTLTPENVDIRTIIETLLFEHASEIKQRGIKLTLDVPPITLTADPDSLSQALRNLIDNAIKFTANTSHPAIHIGGRKTKKACVIEVRDNGIGFDMKDHARIFKIFQRLQNAKEYPGTGIGLALVHKAMQRIDGRVWAESKPGEGAAFYLEIPARKTGKERTSTTKSA